MQLLCTGITINSSVIIVMYYNYAFAHSKYLLAPIY